MKISVPNPLSHAYIITGGGEESRRDCARHLAAAYLCEGGAVPCGSCRHCVKVEKNIHPDVYVLSPAEDKREIVADQARALRTDAYIRPNEGERKVYVIDPAESMNPTAQNALLKVLEDGPGYTAFLLLARQPGRLLETIRSRCETITLPPEETVPDPDLTEKAEALAGLLLHGSEWEVARSLTQLELEKLKSAQVLELLAAAEPMVARELTCNRRAAQVLKAMQACREYSVYNVGAGHILGWLSAELFREAR